MLCITVAPTQFYGCYSHIDVLFHNYPSVNYNLTYVILISQLKKSRSDADERQRKSLLPWSRKTRAKSRDRVSLDRDDSSISSSRSSLTTWDVPLSSGLCRVILPDGSTAVVHTRPNQTVRYLISRLLDKRALAYNDFQVVHNYLNKVIELVKKLFANVPIWCNREFLWARFEIRQKNLVQSYRNSALF